MIIRKFLSHNPCQIRNLWTKKKPSFGKYSIVTPGNVSAHRAVPDHIEKPCYYETGEPNVGPTTPEIKSDDQIERMCESCRLAANILQAVASVIKPGVTTDDIDSVVHKLTVENNAYPSPLYYRGFPKSVCTSVNNVACHGIPDDRPLENGDIVNVDITVYLNGYHGDCSKNFLVGDVDEVGRNLVLASEMCLNGAIELCKPGTPFNRIGNYIERRAHEFGFKIIPAFVGHGIGSYFHGAPDILHFTNNYGGIMRAGMTFTIEPVLTQGFREIEILEDNWTAVTTDNARTAQTEHTILITPDGHEVLTQTS